jgi:hypothetical protein
MSSRPPGDQTAVSGFAEMNGENEDMTAEELFWELAEPMYADPGVQRSTMMGLPCLRLDGRFFASLDRRHGTLVVKLPAERVLQLIDAGHGQPFAPAGRTFREWVALPVADPRRWEDLLAEARDHAAGPARSLRASAGKACQLQIKGPLQFPAGLAAYRAVVGQLG